MVEKFAPGIACSQALLTHLEIYHPRIAVILRWDSEGSHSLIKLPKEVNIRPQSYTNPMQKQYRQLLGRCMRSVVVAEVLGWRSLGNNQSLKTRRQHSHRVED